MRFFSKPKKYFLFVCVENSARSQMAEGFFRKYAPKGYEPLSAGTMPKDKVNPLAVEVMNEIGIDISDQKPKLLSEELMRSSSKIVNMGCMYEGWCPTQYANVAIDWGLEDPKGKPIEKFRQIRDQIEEKVKTLCDSLMVSSR
jgi:protein-tyrosine-phosphatase